MRRHVLFYFCVLLVSSSSSLVLRFPFSVFRFPFCVFRFPFYVLRFRIYVFRLVSAAPNVDSALIHFSLRRSTEVPDVGRSPKQFLSFVNAAFSSRRKMLRNNLKGTYDMAAVEAALESLGLPAAARPQDLSIDHFVALSRTLVPLNAGGADGDGEGTGDE